MDWWLIILLGGGGALWILRLWLGPAEIAGPETDMKDRHLPEEPEFWEVEALSRYGTETSVEQLVQEGRADELRGLGYEGDLPDA